MKLKNKVSIVVTILTVFVLAASYVSLPVAGAAGAGHPEPPTVAPSPTPLSAEEVVIRQREQRRHGITVEEPRVYDDAMLQQMLRVAEARLAALQVIDQTQLLSRLGATSGATQQISGFGLNVQGAPLPGVVTTSKGATGTTTATDEVTGGTTFSQSAGTSTGTAGNTTSVSSGEATGSKSTLQSVSGLATQDMVTTRGQFGPLGATAPSPSTTLPSSGLSVSSSDILNEQMQLTAEINGLRLLLAGDLSGHYVRRNSAVTKLKTTLGFPVTLIPDERHKDAVAIVEVEVERSRPGAVEKRRMTGTTAELVHNMSSDGEDKSGAEAEVSYYMSSEKPMITALLPREKTYNVAAITDKSVSIGGGVATQIVGISGSWLWGRKTHYLVQDQDTVALAFKPSNEQRVGFMWEFKPVLGRRYVKAGLKQTFVQLAFDAPRDAKEGEIGKVIFRTYWRRYDRKSGIHKEIIGQTLSSEVTFDIPSYSLAVRPPAFNHTNLEEISEGQLLVNLKGRFLPGTYVRIGSELLSLMPRFSHEHAAIRFTAPIADLATKQVFLVAHDGTEVPLKFRGCGINQAGTEIVNFVPDGDPVIKVVDDTKSSVTVNFVRRITPVGGKPMNEAPAVTARMDIPDLVVVIGSRVFGYSELKRKWDPTKGVNELSVVIPTKELAAKPELSIYRLFPDRKCRTTPMSIASYIPPSQGVKLLLLEHGASGSRFLLSGSALKGIQVLSPGGVEPKDIGGASEEDKLKEIRLTKAQLATHDDLLLQRVGGRPFTVKIPSPEPKKADPPTVKGTVKPLAQSVVIEGAGLGDLEKVTFEGREIKFDILSPRKVRLKGLKDAEVTTDTTTQTLLLKFKSGAEEEVEIEVVDLVTRVKR